MSRRALLLVWLPACGAGQLSRSSNVAEGRYFGTGDPDFDEFFLTLFRLQEEIESTSVSFAASRAELARSLGLPSASEDAQLFDALRERTRRLWRSGVRVRARRETEKSPDPSTAPLVIRMSAPVSAEDRTVFDLVRHSSLEFSRASSRMRPAEQRLAELGFRTAELARRSDIAFRRDSASKREAVRANLRDAGDAIANLRRKAASLDRASRELLALVKRGADTAESGIAPDGQETGRAQDDKPRPGRVRSRTNLPDRPKP